MSEEKKLDLQRKITFGKYKGHTLEAIASHPDGASYLLWALKKVKFFKMSVDEQMYCLQRTKPKVAAAFKEYPAECDDIPSGYSDDSYYGWTFNDTMD